MSVSQRPKLYLLNLYPGTVGVTIYNETTGRSIIYGLSPTQYIDISNLITSYNDHIKIYAPSADISEYSINGFPSYADTVVLVIKKGSVDIETTTVDNILRSISNNISETRKPTVYLLSLFPNLASFTVSGITKLKGTDSIVPIPNKSTTYTLSQYEYVDISSLVPSYDDGIYIQPYTNVDMSEYSILGFPPNAEVVMIVLRKGNAYAEFASTIDDALKSVLHKEILQNVDSYLSNLYEVLLSLISDYASGKPLSQSALSNVSSSLQQISNILQNAKQFENKTSKSFEEVTALQQVYNNLVQIYGSLNKQTLTVLGLQDLQLPSYRTPEASAIASGYTQFLNEAINIMKSANPQKNSPSPQPSQTSTPANPPQSSAPTPPHTTGTSPQSNGSTPSSTSTSSSSNSQSSQSSPPAKPVSSSSSSTTNGSSSQSSNDSSPSHSSSFIQLSPPSSTGSASSQGSASTSTSTSPSSSSSSSTTGSEGSQNTTTSSISYLTSSSSSTTNGTSSQSSVAPPSPTTSPSSSVPFSPTTVPPQPVTPPTVTSKDKVLAQIRAGDISSLLSGASEIPQDLIPVTNAVIQLYQLYGIPDGTPLSTAVERLLNDLRDAYYKISNHKQEEVNSQKLTQLLQIYNTLANNGLAPQSQSASKLNELIQTSGTIPALPAVLGQYYPGRVYSVYSNYSNYV